jgi:hypothetical protein
MTTADDCFGLAFIVDMLIEKAINNNNNNVAFCPKQVGVG